MLKITERHTHTTPNAVLSIYDQQRKTYQKPHLQVLGDVRTNTLGGSMGQGDSGGTLPQFPFSLNSANNQMSGSSALFLGKRPSDRR